MERMKISESLLIFNVIFLVVELLFKKQQIKYFFIFVSNFGFTEF
jgi:hypothetical protein